MLYLILIIGLLINAKIYYWTTISRKGFRSETPEGFLRNPNLYSIVNIIFFIVAVSFSGVPWYLVLIAYFLSFILAWELAEKKYNKIVKELEEDEHKF